MRNVLIAATAAVVAVGSITLPAAPVTSAGGPCGLANAHNRNQRECIACWEANDYNLHRCGIDEWKPAGTGQAP